MDRISVTNDTLQNVSIVLQGLKDNSKRITTRCVSMLSSHINGLDGAFSVDIQRYIESITILEERIEQCVDENISAISERLNKIPDYEKQTYKKRNIV